MAPARCCRAGGHGPQPGAQNSVAAFGPGPLGCCLSPRSSTAPGQRTQALHVDSLLPQARPLFLGLPGRPDPALCAQPPWGLICLVCPCPQLNISISFHIHDVLLRGLGPSLGLAAWRRSPPAPAPAPMRGCLAAFPEGPAFVGGSLWGCRQQKAPHFCQVHVPQSPPSCSPCWVLPTWPPLGPCHLLQPPPRPPPPNPASSLHPRGKPLEFRGFRLHTMGSVPPTS